MIPFQACVLGDFFCVFQLRRFTKSCPYLPFFLGGGEREDRRSSCILVFELQEMMSHGNFLWVLFTG